jgi:hypothetical protein
MIKEPEVYNLLSQLATNTLQNELRDVDIEYEFEAHTYMVMKAYIDCGRPVQRDCGDL